MRERILAGVRNVNSWLFTGIAILFAVVLTTGLNSLFVWIDKGHYNPKIFMYATIDAILIPLIIAPIMINMLKRLLNLEQANQVLQGQLEERQQAQKVAEERVENLQAISDFAITCSAASPDDDLYKLIAEKLHKITGSMGVAISEYDAKEQVLITRDISVSGQILSSLNNFLGRNIIGFRSPVSRETLEYISNSVVAPVADLHEVSFGAIPKTISAIIQSTFGIGNVTGLAFIYGGELWGTAIIVMKKEHPPIDQNLALALANVAAMAMRRQKTEEALQASEARYRTLVDLLPDAITLADLTGNIIYCNQQTAVIHGYENADQVFGKNILDHFAPEEHANVLEKVQNAFLLQKINDEPFTLLKQDGSRFPGEIRAHLILEKGGIPTGILGITRDVTGRKKAESEREILIHELQSKNRELEQFTYTVSHDLKAPIITIKGFLGMLQKDMGSNRQDRIQSDMHRIDEAADKMLRLLTELLELSRIGRMMNPPEKVSFVNLVNDALDLVRGRLDAGRVRVTVQPDLPTVCGDRQRLTEVLQNLIDNAAKFMGSQSDPQIEIGQRGTEDGKPVFFVHDNGIGIAPEHHERIFGLFNKLDPHVEGTGVGLALVKRIVEVHGGRIWVESEPGQGTVFCFTMQPTC